MTQLLLQALDVITYLINLVNSLAKHLYSVAVDYV